MLLQLAALCTWDSVPQAASRPGTPSARAPTEAPRRKERRLDMRVSAPSAAGSTDMDYLQVVGLPECG